MTITAVIITKNEEKNIARCLKSLHEITDEIIVLDSFSTDNTSTICEQYPSVKFIQKEWAGYAAAKNFADEQATSNFILSIDADEMVSEELKESILDIKSKKMIHKAYQFNRLNHIGNEPVHFSGWYPDRKIRLFPTKNSHWEGDFAHETLKTIPEIDTLNGDLLHFTCSTFEEMSNKQSQYAELGAHELYEKGKHISAFKRAVKVFFKFFSIYILKLGILDGSKGFKIASISAYYLNYKFNVLERLYHKKKDNNLEIKTEYHYNTH
jgi:glycosyltransferase involved in cell wall biosynthesis